MQGSGNVWWRFRGLGPSPRVVSSGRGFKDRIRRFALYRVEERSVILADIVVSRPVPESTGKPIVIRSSCLSSAGPARHHTVWGCGSSTADAPDFRRRLTVLTSEDAAPAIGWRALPLLRNQFLHCRADGMTLEPSSLVVKPFQRAELLRLPQFCFPDRRFQHLDGLVVHAERHRKRMPVLAAVGDGEACRVGEAVRRTVYHLSYHGQRLHGPRSHAGNEEEFRKVPRAAICRRRQIAAQPTLEDIGWADVVMRRHGQVRQQRLLRRRGGLQFPSRYTPQLASDSVRAQRLKNIELHAAGRCGAAVSEVDDFALTKPINRGMRLFDETLETFG